MITWYTARVGCVSVPSRRSLYSNIIMGFYTAINEQFPSPLGDPYIQILSFSPRINPIIFAPLAAQTKLAPQEALNPIKKSRFC